MANPSILQEKGIVVQFEKDRHYKVFGPKFTDLQH